jgi:M6 family metalloprotease-like protein
MNRTVFFRTLSLGFVCLVALRLSAAEPTAKGPDLSEYRTVETAIKAKDIKSKQVVEAQPGYLGLLTEADETGKVVAAEVAADSPAAKAGLKRGDVLTHLDGKPLTESDAFTEALLTKAPGAAIRLAVTRQGKSVQLTATLAAPSHPQQAGPTRAVLGIDVEKRKDGDGVVIKTVAANSPAERARLKVDEVVLKIDDTTLTSSDRLREIISAKKPDEEVTLTLYLADKAVEMKVRLGAEGAAGAGGGGSGRRGGGGGGAGWDNRVGNYWQKDNYKLAIILIEYPDTKINAKIPTSAWNDAMFSQGTYKKTVTGQTAYGSLYDYYFEQSYGHLKVSGKAFAPVEVSKKRMEYSGPGTNRLALLTEALDKLLAREGKDALKDFEGIIYVYAGGRPQVARGSLYWPHRASVNYQGKRWPYFICNEGGERMANISVFCHEFGHMLGLPDLYARPENPGSEGLGIWCAMSNQAGNGRPQHFSAWCKEKLGWLKPTELDPTVPQKLILGAVEDSPKECFKVAVRPDGREYLLLENRRHKGFDASLPAEGLLIWRVVGPRPFLEESHGIEGPAGPGAFTKMVPFPSNSNDSFTPYTTPSSRAQLGGGMPVHITNIRQLPDGRVTFYIGYEYE